MIGKYMAAPMGPKTANLTNCEIIEGLRYPQGQVQ